MIPPPIPANELERLHALRGLGILDTLPEEDFDDLTNLAAAISGMPISLISLVDQDRQWFKAKKGIAETETERELSFCAHAINDPNQTMIIPDARIDERFSNNPLVTNNPYVIFYAGFPLTNEDGLSFGTLCVIDNKPNVLTETQKNALQILSKQVLNLLELRRKNAQLAAQEKANTRLINIYERTNTAAKIGWWEVNFESGEIEWSTNTKRIHEVAVDFEPHINEAIYFYKEAHRATVSEAVINCLIHGTPYEFELELTTAKGNSIWVSAIGTPEFAEPGESVHLHESFSSLLTTTPSRPVKKMNGTFQEITNRKKNEQILEIRNKELQQLNDLISVQNTRLQNFAHIISHNIRSHVTNMSGVIQLADNNVVHAGDMIFEVFKKSVSGLEETIANLNEVIYIQSNLNVPKKLLLINEELDKIITLLYHQINDSGAVINLSGNCTEIYTNPAYFESILQNLISNAIKYRSPDRRPIIEVSLTQQKEYTVLQVTDNGLGIDLQKYGSRIFGMYKTFHRNKDAKGLGLFITKTQIEALNGKIEITSTVNAGTTFTAYFPIED
jgi:signal transduction histidine kinase